MNSKEKFMNFLEAIKTDENSKLIENVKKGFDACYESRGMDLGTAPVNVLGGIGTNIPKSDTPEIYEECLPDPSEAGPEVAEVMSDDLMKVVEILKSNPEIVDKLAAALL